LSPPHAVPTIGTEPITGHLKTNVILIDFENVQPKDLAQLRGRPFKTKVFCGANQTKVPFDLAAELQPLGPDAEYIKIQGTGPNALDFHIAYYIGRLSTEIPGATFHIVSKDKGFDPLIKHLKTQTRQALEMLLKAGHKVRIQTRSTLARRDFDLFAEFKDQVRLGISLPHLDDRLAAVLEPKAPPPSSRLEMLRDAARMGIPVYVAIAPFMPFHPLSVLDEVVGRTKPLRPTEIFCEVLNPKGDCIERVARVLAPAYPAESSVVKGYNDAAWSKWTHEVLRHGVAHYAKDGFIAWPDTGRGWEKHLSPPEVKFLNQFLPS
jgi:hypothetical protein